jgi:2-keto-4-pentenoate hydratase
MGFDLDNLARRQLADYDARRPGAMFGDPGFELTLEEAYQLQLRVANLREARGEAIAGYKVGCISDAIQRQFGLREPVFGHVFASEIHRSGASLNAANFHQLAIEGEFALRIAEDIPSAAWLASNARRAIARSSP